MKRILPILTVAFLLACNPGKEKTATENNTTTDPAETNIVASSDKSQQAVLVADTTPVPANRLIIPGKSIGLTSIDQKNAEAMKHLGPPATKDAAMGKELATWYSIHGKDTVSEVNIFFITNMGADDEASRVNHIRVTSPFFMTALHIGTGSVQDSIKKYFPGIKKIAAYTSTQTKSQVLVYDDNHSGVAFEIANGKCVGITVHKPGGQAYETYNALFGDVKFY